MCFGPESPASVFSSFRSGWVYKGPTAVCIRVKAAKLCPLEPLGRMGKDLQLSPCFPATRREWFVLLALGKRASHATKPWTCGLRFPVQGLPWPHLHYSYLLLVAPIRITGLSTENTAAVLWRWGATQPPGHGFTAFSFPR